MENHEREGGKEKEEKRRKKKTKQNREMGREKQTRKQQSRIKEIYRGQNKDEKEGKKERWGEGEEEGVMIVPADAGE
jgi:hypothetical protein